MKLEFLNHKIPPPFILLISGIAIWLLKNIAPLPIPYSIRAILGTFFIVFGFGLDLAGLLEFRKFQTTMNPLKPENASKIVQTGIYSKTRNPMYLGMVFVLIGWSIIAKASFGILVIPLFIKYIETFQIIPEEEILSSQFGEEYDNYISKTARWI